MAFPGGFPVDSSIVLNGRLAAKGFCPSSVSGVGRLEKYVLVSIYYKALIQPTRLMGA
jgi:hypothetical protein